MLVIDKKLAEDILDALDTGCTNGGFGDTIYEVCDSYWEFEQRPEIQQAIQKWLKRCNYRITEDSD